MPLSANRPTPSRHQPSREHDPWLRRLAQKYNTPRALLARHLALPGALEYEIAQLIVDAAVARAYDLFADGAPAPTGADIFDRAVRGVYGQLEAQRDRVEEEERQRRYAASDAELARIKAGQA